MAITVLTSGILTTRLRSGCRHFLYTDFPMKRIGVLMKRLNILYELRLATEHLVTRVNNDNRQKHECWGKTATAGYPREPACAGPRLNGRKGQRIPQRMARPSVEPLFGVTYRAGAVELTSRTATLVAYGDELATRCV